MSMPFPSVSSRLVRLIVPLMLVVVVIAGSRLIGQQKVLFNNGIPVAPTGLTKRPRRAAEAPAERPLAA